MFHYSVHVDPFLPPQEVTINLINLGSRQLIFSWNVVAPDCPAIHYNILTSNCGTCPTTTNHTNAICTDVPIDQDIFCTFVLQTVVCRNITGTLSNPIWVLLSNARLRDGTIIDRGNTNNGNAVVHGSRVHACMLYIAKIKCVLMMQGTYQEPLC